MDDFEYLSPFYFLSIEFHCTFSISYKILPNFVCYYCILVRMLYAVGTFFFVPALLLSILTPLSLPSSSVSLSYFILAVCMRECFGFPMSYSHTEWYLFFSRGEMVCNLGRSFVYQNHIKVNYVILLTKKLLLFL